MYGAVNASCRLAANANINANIMLISMWTRTDCLVTDALHNKQQTADKQWLQFRTGAPPPSGLPEKQECLTEYSSCGLWKEKNKHYNIKYKANWIHGSDEILSLGHLSLKKTWQFLLKLSKKKLKTRYITYSSCFDEQIQDVSMWIVDWAQSDWRRVQFEVSFVLRWCDNLASLNIHYYRTRFYGWFCNSSSSLQIGAVLLPL